LKNPGKILIIRLSSFGDIILTFPLIKHIKELFPESRIDYITKDEYIQLVSANKDIDAFFTFGKNSIKDLRKIIKSRNYELIIDLHNNIRSIFLRLFQNAKIVRYKKRNLKKFLLVLFKINLFKEIIPVYNKYILAVAKIFTEIKTNYVTADFNIAQTAESGYILMCPTSKHFTKTYPKEKFRDIAIKNQNQTFYLVSGNSQNEREICGFIADGNLNVKNLSGETDFNKLMSLIKNSKFVICNDSGILHLSESIGKKVIAIFGSTVREFGFYPQLKESVIIENQNLDCRPCSRAGLESCPKGHFKCMNELNINLNEYLS
jgi:heptosyltransferase-2